MRKTTVTTFAWCVCVCVCVFKRSIRLHAQLHWTKLMICFFSPNHSSLMMPVCVAEINISLTRSLTHLGANVGLSAR